MTQYFRNNVNSSLSKEKLVEICEIMVDDVRILFKCYFV